MNKTKFTEKNLKELKVLADESKKTLVNLGVQKQQRKLKNIHELREKRKELARILTAAREKEIAQ
ncbi:MAG: 50S ribosomal protein L29 [bacterium]|nr:50S ribosomal protein L29 [bacterium]